MPSVLKSSIGNEQLQSIGISTAVTPSATPTVDLTTDAQVYTWTAGENETVAASGTQLPGRQITCKILDDGTRTITFGTGFKAAATIVGVDTKVATITFVSDGTSLWEISRAVEITP